MGMSESTINPGRKALLCPPLMSQELAISCQAADAQHVNFVVHLSYCLKSPPDLQRTFLALAPSQDT